ncbi:MAG: glucose-6-phosphate isomerase family protein, partial [Halobacteriota archaeon]
MTSVDIIQGGGGHPQLAFGSHLVDPAVRRLYDLRAVAFDTAWFEGASDRDVYYMYRDLSRSPHEREIIEVHELRYDITTIPPFKMGHEFVKTLGHYHPRVSPESSFTYPEVYEVLEGEAHYVLQRPANEGVDDVLLVRAVKGDKVIVPPNYGHVTINPSEHTLTMANWVCRSFESVY